MDKIDKPRFTNLIFSECPWSLNQTWESIIQVRAFHKMYYIKMRMQGKCGERLSIKKVYF